MKTMLKTQKIKNDIAKKTLYYYALKKENDQFHIDYKDYDLEHILPKKNNETNKLLNNIGNLTILESSNSKNGHVGNRSIKNNDFEKKKKSYQGSSLLINKDLTKIKTKTFSDEHISNRGVKIVNDMCEMMNIALNDDIKKVNKSNVNNSKELLPKKKSKKK